MNRNIFNEQHIKLPRQSCVVFFCCTLLKIDSPMIFGYCYSLRCNYLRVSLIKYEDLGAHSFTTSDSSYNL